MNPKAASPVSLPESYVLVLNDIKSRIRESQLKAALAVNQELIKLYWGIGREISVRQSSEKWGSQVLERLCKDLQSDFPGISGFSRSNLFRMRAFYLAYEIVAQPARQLDTPPEFCLKLPWWHNVILVEQVKNLVEREWYARQAVANGWSRNVLEMWIDSNLYHRQGKAPNNFQKALPSAQSDLAEQIVKDPYSFGFMPVAQEAQEREIETGLMNHLQQFLLELGNGFAFVGRQVPIRIGDEDFYLDLLFYHIKLRCYFLIELKAGKFKPADAGQIDFYLAALDDKFRQPGDNPAIGLILCRSKDRVIVEYALRNKNCPIGVAAFKTELVESLPENFKDSLPSVEEIEAEAAFYAQKTEQIKL
jgi:predicted nuclease of restriction endonuclease-like (RecB) superfamily